MTGPSAPASATALLASALRRLQDGDPQRMQQVRLGAIIPGRKVLGITRAPRVSPVENAWHLGVLLLGEGGVWGTNEIVRAREELPRGFTSENQRRRAELAAAAHRGGFAEGETVHVGWEPLDPGLLDRGQPQDPLLLVEGTPSVRWSPSGAPRALVDYLAEQIDLVLHPPERA